MLTPYFIHIKSWLILLREGSHRSKAAYNDGHGRGTEDLPEWTIGEVAYWEHRNGELPTLGNCANGIGRFANGRGHLFSQSAFSFLVECPVARLCGCHFISHNSKRFPLWLQAGEEKEKLERVAAI
jgi:hypothetical protein